MGGDYGPRPTGPQVTSNQHAAAYGLLRFYEQQQQRLNAGGTPCSSNSSEICVDAPTQEEYSRASPTQPKHEIPSPGNIAVNPVVLHDNRNMIKVEQDSQIESQTPTETQQHHFSQHFSEISREHQSFKTEVTGGYDHSQVA